MKTINIIACSLLLSLLPCLAGGNSSIVDLDKVTSIKN